jgi:hypothetical protein
MNRTRFVVYLSIAVVAVVLVVGFFSYGKNVGAAEARKEISSQGFSCPTPPAYVGNWESMENQIVSIKGEERFVLCMWVNADPLVPTQQP